VSRKVRIRQTDRQKGRKKERRKEGKKEIWLLIKYQTEQQ